MDMRLRRKFKSLTKKSSNGTRLCDGKMASDDPELILALLDVSQDYAGFVRQFKMHDAINIVLGLDLYNKDKQAKMYPEFASFKNLNFKKEVGRIVTVDFFGHFGTELAYEHPAIVLGSEGSSVLVAPLSSPAYGQGRSSHVDLDKDSGIVTLNSAILLEKVRSISKNRILAKHQKLTGQIISPTNLTYGKEKLQEIDEKLANLLVPYHYKRFQQAMQNVNNLQEQYERDKERLQLVLERIETQEEEIIYLKQQLGLEITSA
ncbi:hypothetical protein EJP82_27720 [Paenibacillus anaericanus]|uniref:Type II toxin-antitoxin system PemK/MazF family toxin n=1 Tax=Paenibacillus anaericanus TaxID=170367 RepID=A0A3S1BYV6_9BACL|nr:type II toxin-antitoxin system PemK/MazF family toxin [Paenibacillus anaericanus]RUT37794.1 hypothetical protein EJP82_27720 [Paenibacillus anaericanus]